jgi:hypothetical protein
VRGSVYEGATTQGNDMSEWIKCSETMPPIYKQVLAYGPGKGELVGGAKIEICVWDGDTWWNEGGTELSMDRTETGWRDPNWSHWMPLPDAPVV